MQRPPNNADTSFVKRGVSQLSLVQKFGLLSLAAFALLGLALGYTLRVQVRAQATHSVGPGGRGGGPAGDPAPSPPPGPSGRDGPRPGGPARPALQRRTAGGAGRSAEDLEPRRAGGLLGRSRAHRADLP